MSIAERGIETSMVEISKSLQHWLWENHREKLVYIKFGHIELLTPDMWDDYSKWLSTDEGKKWLEDG